MTRILLTDAEIQSDHSRVDWAEDLILQLPKEHEGRNSWLLNYGKGDEAQILRANRSAREWLENGRVFMWNPETESFCQREDL